MKMGMQWTKEQQQVINLRNRNILVSAAAGSGKTAVLVERIITRLTKDEEPLNIDELLSVTFTNAAAAEMKERILDAIELALESNPGNEHLQKQATLIHNAKITTIHSFCLDVIREYFHVIHLDPTFRTAEDGELSLLKKEVMSDLLEAEYAAASPAFLNFVETIAPGKKDSAIEELLLELYEASRSNPRPEQWLATCREFYDINTVEELNQSIYGKQVLEELTYILDDVRGIMRKAIAICESDGGPLAYREMLNSDLSRMDEIENKASLQELELLLGGSSMWAQLKGVTKKDKDSGAVDSELIEQVKDLRALGKKPIDDFKKDYFSITLEKQVQAFQICASVVNELVRLVLAFDQRYMEKKKAKNILEFNDMEHYALQILTEEVDGELVPSPAAREYQKKFREVMIDEYQDSNLLQETIVTSVSRVSQGEYNVFMVGDVKQSIYRFRASRPELFMDKFNTYSLEDGEKQRIDLHKNFRSRLEVLEGTNYVFQKIMRQVLGGVEYDKKAALYLGANFKEVVGNEMEVRILDLSSIEKSDVDEEATKVAMEAKDVAVRIQELVGKHKVLDKKTQEYRAANYGDIVILTRSTPIWSTITEELERAGVPTHVESKEGYFTSWEIALLLDYLSVIDNPKQDIPLAAVLRSVFGNVTDKELAIIRSRYPGWKFHEAVFAYKDQEIVATDLDEEGVMKYELELEIQSKLRTCLDLIEAYRNQVFYLSIYELLNAILVETGYKEFVYARPEGEQRRANLNKLLETAITFESTSYKGLFNFIRYIEQLQKYKVEMGEASISDSQDNVVRLMTIHKSKGLEFPIVILMGMGKQFNLRDTMNRMVKHQDLGIGMDAVDLTRRVKISTISKKVIANRIGIDSRGEELRVLYVAMTRAKEKLILTGSVDNLADTLEKIQEQNLRENQLSYLQLIKAKTYFDWILPSICYHREFDSVWNRRQKDVDLTHPFRQENPPIRIVEVDLKKNQGSQVSQMAEDIIAREFMEVKKATGVHDKAFSESLDEQLNYTYAFDQEREFKLKVTVSDIKKRAILAEEAGEELIKPVFQVKQAIIPEFIRKQREVRVQQEEQENAKEQKVKGTQRGNAYHRLMEIWNYTKAYSTEEIGEAIDELVESGKLEESMASCIAIEDVQMFLESNLGQRMNHAAKAGLLFKEQPFVMKVPAEDVYHIETQEYIIVQGIIDVYFIEDNQIVLLDYKTDNVRHIEELKDRYQVQLDYYGRAIENLTGKKVKEKVIYAFKFNQELKL